MSDQQYNRKKFILELVRGGRQAQALEASRSFCEDFPADADGWQLQGAIQGQLGNPRAAENCYQHLLSIQPDNAQAHYNLGCLLQQRGEFLSAEASCRRMLVLEPDNIDAQFNLGCLLMQSGDENSAEIIFTAILNTEPLHYQAHFNLGVLAQNQQRYAQAESRYRATLAIRPEVASVYNNLGTVLQEQGRLEAAATTFMDALKLDPMAVQSWYNLGTTRVFQGKADAAVEAYRRVVDLQPGFSQAWSNLLFCMNYSDAWPAKVVYAEHLRWAQRYADPLLAEVLEPGTRQHKRLRIGYVSPDFRHHPVGYFMHPVLAAHDHSVVEVFCYSNVAVEDDKSKELKALVDTWRNIHALDDVKVAALIRDDCIDVLVDLAGHTDNNRALVFARRPAPVQVAYLGYLNTTGMQAMDFRLTDKWADPVGVADDLYTEKLVRLPYGQLCLLPPIVGIEPGELPAQQVGHITFGCFNNSAKISDRVVVVWSDILKALPGARLVLRSRQLGDETEAASMLARFRERGIPSSRVDIHGRCVLRDYLAGYNAIDIALDPFPYNGGTVTCHALWMGVPVVSLAGEHGFSRTGSSILNSIGMGDYVADSERDYVNKAIALAKALPLLSELRSSLRAKLLDAPVMNAEIFTHSIESAFQGMWHDRYPKL